ncbi:MAG TPA: hypothetical protein PKK43_12440 [Spirochaetota bacterium]|nr:hypothetical protein [Spirochaetota bacterium]
MFAIILIVTIFRCGMIYETDVCQYVDSKGETSKKIVIEDNVSITISHLGEEVQAYTEDEDRWKNNSNILISFDMYNCTKSIFIDNVDIFILDNRSMIYPERIDYNNGAAYATEIKEFKKNHELKGLELKCGTEHRFRAVYNKKMYGNALNEKVMISLIINMKVAQFESMEVVKSKIEKRKLKPIDSPL